MDAAWEEALHVCSRTINGGESAKQASIWTTIIKAFDPREPWTASERDQSAVREALASVRHSHERLAAWFIDAYMNAFHHLCMYLHHWYLMSMPQSIFHLLSTLALNGS